jgi:hypothetical protein
MLVQLPSSSDLNKTSLLSDASNPCECTQFVAFISRVPDAKLRQNAAANHYTASDQQLFVPLQINPAHACFPPPEPQSLTGMLKTAILNNLQQQDCSTTTALDL